ncbi:peptide deformylase [Collinsella sp. AGMB00827]|uniref:Peptide deformylase n=1 Tax=Collinsella ureilytica TaxID=2869515 RepID=A0ABS7MHX1_9ACTN|nr:peptide deformylase [Collinsella urealyticum]MBY4796837.1 peptide deformylase [Collinsella urealyticum]
MEVDGVVLSPDPRLRCECAEIDRITPEIVALAERMRRIMFEDGGCGLAAPQVGENLQMVLVDTTYTDATDYDPYVLINPVIVESSDVLVPYTEGCLSIPGITCEIMRPDRVVVEAYDLSGDLLRYEAARDLFCVCLQHEIDHIHGITMFERLSGPKRMRALKEYQEALARGARPGETA